MKKKILSIVLLLGMLGPTAALLGEPCPSPCTGEIPLCGCPTCPGVCTRDTSDGQCKCPDGSNGGELCNRCGSTGVCLSPCTGIQPNCICPDGSDGGSTCSCGEGHGLKKGQDQPGTKLTPHERGIGQKLGHEKHHD